MLSFFIYQRVYVLRVIYMITKVKVITLSGLMMYILKNMREKKKV